MNKSAIEVIQMADGSCHWLWRFWISWKPSVLVFFNRHYRPKCHLLWKILSGIKFLIHMAFQVQRETPGWCFQYFFYVHPYLGKIPILTNMFQVGWNHQLETHVFWWLLMLLMEEILFHLGYIKPWKWWDNYLSTRAGFLLSAACLDVPLSWKTCIHGSSDLGAQWLNGWCLSCQQNLTIGRVFSVGLSTIHPDNQDPVDQLRCLQHFAAL